MINNIRLIRSKGVTTYAERLGQIGPLLTKEVKMEKVKKVVRNKRIETKSEKMALMRIGIFTTYAPKKKKSAKKAIQAQH